MSTSMKRGCYELLQGAESIISSFEDSSLTEIEINLKKRLREALYSLVEECQKAIDEDLI